MLMRILEIIIFGAAILRVLYYYPKFNAYFKQHSPKIVLNILVISWSVIFGAFIAMELTKKLNEEENKENYLSLLNSCKNMNERYLKDLKSIYKIMISDSGFVNYSEINRLTTKIDPFMLEQIIMDSDLYKYSSQDFRNWLPDYISFMKSTNWILTDDNIELMKINNRYLQGLKQIMINEMFFINNELREESLVKLNNKTRKEFILFSGNKSIHDIIAKTYKKELTDSLKY